jgi:ABC-2 type transport system ATP-binding protein
VGARKKIPLLYQIAALTVSNLEGPKTMIDVQNLTKAYGASEAVRDISFHLEPGEIVGFLGPNGAGKTTTMRMLTGYHPPTTGSATIAGFDVHTQPLEVKRRVGYLPESVPLYLEMVVSSYLSYIAEIKGIDRSKRKSEIADVLERCGLTHMGKRLIGNLSKGYRQRVGLAQALLGNPPVLILDEPTVGLDPKQIVGIRQMIKDLASDHTVLLSTHILPEVSMICDRVIILHQGKIVTEKRLSDLSETQTLEELFIESISTEAEVSHG